MEPWKMIGFGRDTHVNHDYLVTSSSRAVHFIGQPKIQNIFDSEMKSTDSKVAPPGRNKTRNYHICPEPQGEFGFNEGECCFNWKRLKTVRRGPKRDPNLGDVCIHVCHFLTQEMMNILIYVYVVQVCIYKYKIYIYNIYVYICSGDVNLWHKYASLNFNNSLKSSSWSTETSDHVRVWNSILGSNKLMFKV